MPERGQSRTTLGISRSCWLDWDILMWTMDDWDREHLGNAIAAGIFIVCLIAFPGGGGFILGLMLVLGWIGIQIGNRQK